MSSSLSFLMMVAATVRAALLPRDVAVAVDDVDGDDS
jgi:hypothetical protein